MPSLGEQVDFIRDNYVSNIKPENENRKRFRSRVLWQLLEAAGCCKKGSRAVDKFSIDVGRRPTADGLTSYNTDATQVARLSHRLYSMRMRSVDKRLAIHSPPPHYGWTVSAGQDWPSQLVDIDRPMRDKLCNDDFFFSDWS